MRRAWRHLAVGGALVLGLTAWGCEYPTEPIPEPPQLEAEAEDPFLFGLGRRLSRLLSRTLDTTEELGELAGLSPVTGPLVDLTREIVALIGPEGGVLQLDDHVLTVPAGAVEGLTSFTMRYVDNGAVEVELKAVEGSANVGASGFEVPVRLALSYADSDVDDPEDLVIVRVQTEEPLETHLDTSGEQVWADLEHFSRYRLCSN